MAVETATIVRILISGGGIGGLTLAYWLKKFGFEPVVIEKSPALRTEGYMIDFFGSGWDVAERMGLVERLRAVKYPIRGMSFVDGSGKAFFRTDLDRFREACRGRYAYCLRSDLESLLWNAIKDDVEVRFSTSVRNLSLNRDPVEVTFDNENREHFDLVIGADGVSSNIRRRVFGPDALFSRYLGFAVAAFRVPNRWGIKDDLLIYQEPNRQAAFYPLAQGEIAALYLFKGPDPGFVPAGERIGRLLDAFDGAGWILQDVLRAVPEGCPLFFDSLTQIRMPSWYQRRVALVGDACGCLTLLAGQGASMAMAESFVLASELKKSGGDSRPAFQAYEKFLRPVIDAKQHRAVRFSKNFIPAGRFRIWLQRTYMRAAMSRLFIRRAAKFLGSESVLKDYGNSETDAVAANIL
ncbi:MAG TPA: FAD-dependent monooxygenase [bacterium]|nr:FAD-dependent monooxygenase [bacterium]